MKQTIEKNSVERYTIKNKELSLDPFLVTIEGNKIDISCWDTVGTSYFGSPGEDGIKKFLTGIGYEYWAKNFFYEKINNTLDKEATLKAIKEKVKELRFEASISKENARELWDYFEEVFSFSSKQECEVWAYERLYNDLERVLCVNKLELTNIREYFNPYEGGIEIYSEDDPCLKHMWFKGWLPFIEYLCKEINIKYEQPWTPPIPRYISL